MQRPSTLIAMGCALVCCGEPMVLEAESAYGRLLGETAINKGIPIARWRCQVCGSRVFEGWSPPTWISATARAAIRIEKELARRSP